MVIARRSCKFSLPPKSGIASIQWMALPQRSQPRGHPHAAHRRLLSRANAAEDLWSLPLKMHSIPTIGLSMVVSTLGDAPTQCCFDLANDGFRLHVYIPPCKKKNWWKLLPFTGKFGPTANLRCAQIEVGDIEKVRALRMVARKQPLRWSISAGNGENPMLIWNGSYLQYSVIARFPTILCWGCYEWENNLKMDIHLHELFPWAIFQVWLPYSIIYYKIKWTVKCLGGWWFRPPEKYYSKINWGSLFRTSPIGMENQNQTNHTTNHSSSWWCRTKKWLKLAPLKIEDLKMDDSKSNEVDFTFG